MASRAERAAAALAFGCVGLVGAYALVRSLGRFTGSRESPSSVLWVEHSAMPWSLLNALWLAAMVAFAGWMLVRREPDAAPRWLARGIVIAMAAILVQGLLWP